MRSPDDGSIDYYDSEGKSARKFLMRKPMTTGKFRSGFGMRRHPILGYRKMHAGVDWCSPETRLPDVARMMRDADVGAVPVGEHDRLIGMVTDRDIVCRGFADGKDPTSLTARDVMTPGIVYCTEDQSIEDAIRLMENKQVRRMPVINGKKRMTGMLSLGDLSHAAGHERTGERAEAVAAHH